MPLNCTHFVQKTQIELQNEKEHDMTASKCSARNIELLHSRNMANNKNVSACFRDNVFIYSCCCCWYSCSWFGPGTLVLSFVFIVSVTSFMFERYAALVMFTTIFIVVHFYFQLKEQHLPTVRVEFNSIPYNAMPFDSIRFSVESVTFRRIYAFTIFALCSCHFLLKQPTPASYVATEVCSKNRKRCIDILNKIKFSSF